MRMFICLLVAIIMAQACYSQETNIRIRGYHDGELTFNQISNAAYYRVDWAPKADGPWSQSWSKFQAVPPTTNDAITLSLPKFYRVTAILQGSLSGLIAHYAFDEDTGVKISDKACPGNYGDLHGASWVGTNGIGGAYSFDGIDDYIELGSSDLYQRQGQLSGCGWINRKSRHMLLLTNYRGGSAYNGQFGFGIDSAGSLLANFGQGPGQWLCYAAATPDIVPSNEWHHVAFTYDEGRGVGNKIKLYLDGVEIEGRTVYGEGNGGPILQTSDRIRVMMNPALPFPNWPSKGMIHEIMLFDRSLSAVEVKQIYDAH